MIVLETARLLFRAHRLSDVDAFCALEADAAFRRYVGGRPRPRDEAEARFRERFLDVPPGRPRLWATVFKATEEYIGYCGVYPHVDRGRLVPAEGALGYYLAPAYWGRGLGNEAASAFVAHAFGPMNLSRLVAHVDASNGPSVHILEALGFAPTGDEAVGTRRIRTFELLRPASGGRSSGDAGPDRAGTGDPEDSKASS